MDKAEYPNKARSVASFLMLEKITFFIQIRVHVLQDQFYCFVSINCTDEGKDNTSNLKYLAAFTKLTKKEFLEF
jgi:hypothetical protein